MMLRVFPGVVVIPLVVKAMVEAWRRGRPAPRHIRFFVAAVVVVVATFLASLSLPGGLDHWKEFESNLSLHMASMNSNRLGLTETLAIGPGKADVTYEDHLASVARRKAIRDFQLQLLAVPLLWLLWLLWRLAPRRTDLGALGLGVMLLFFVLSLSGYYWSVLLVLLLLYRASPKRLALIFAVELVSFTMNLFELAGSTLFVVRGLSLMVVFAMMLWLDHGNRRLTGGDTSVQEPA